MTSTDQHKTKRPKLMQRLAAMSSQGTPHCECGTYLSTLSSAFQKAWAEEEGEKWGRRKARNGGSGSLCCWLLVFWLARASILETTSLCCWALVSGQMLRAEVAFTVASAGGPVPVMVPAIPPHTPEPQKTFFKQELVEDREYLGI